MIDIEMKPFSEPKQLLEQYLVSVQRFGSDSPESRRLERAYRDAVGMYTWRCG